MSTINEALKVNLDVEIKGEATLVSPAEETPKGSYLLSNLDMAPVMVQTIYCFNKTFDNEMDAAQTIKEGLAKVLVYYYPLAGRLTMNEKHKFMINCTGEGALFLEAEANCTLEEIDDFMKPESVTLGRLCYDAGGAQNPALLAAQVTKFKCGGFVFALSMNHIMFDGIGAMEFVNSWGEITRGLPLSNPPYLDRTLLRARNPCKVEFNYGLEEIVDISNTVSPLEEEMLINKSFVFHPEKLDQLKKKAMEDGVLKKCTTFETLTAFTWRAQTKSLGLHPDQQVRILFAVNARSKLNPPLPEGYFGNAVLYMSCQSSAEMLDRPLSSTIWKIQETINSVTNNYVRSAIDFLEEHKGMPVMTHSTFVSAWSRLAFHSVDFGWGVPFYSGPLNVPRNSVLFLPCGKDRKGINVFLSLTASSMKVFEELIEV
ncbi:hypothetical protein C5167_017990 [Papaver somniferum]|uniref:Omega-hydroxypalmitate O-feruloyl transferase n=1 Tax=Papaver somniferum TaxID=3469 RepID=A0A4Y7IQ20_PAPSO|nr:omega-hydroxypalmitate O-feruloyl transferase-like [Papaver somniferum]RZC49565.1 hypothetical protein C5167_017990 [Papaver somniferum]